MKPICLLGSPDDKQLVYLAWLAQQQDLAVVWLDEARLGREWALRLLDTPCTWTLRCAERDYQETDVAGICVRFDPDIGANDVFKEGSAEELFLISERRIGLQHWLCLARQPVVNRPHAGRENAAKPRQMQQLGNDGISVPRWIVTNDADRSRRFLDSCADGAVVKSCSGLRPRVKRAGDWIVDHLRSGSSPVVLQEYIAGGEVRVHVVGTRTFPTRVDSPDIDYRFSQDPTGYEVISLPAPIRRACVGHAARAGLTLAGFDFRISETGQWFCLEMNPVPSFLPYEMATGLPIAHAILEELVG